MAWTEAKVATLSPQMLLQLEKNPWTNKTWKQNLPWPGTAVPTVPKCAPFHFCWVERRLVNDCSHLPGHTWIFNAFVLQLYSWTSGPRPEAALAAKSEHVMCPTSMDLPPAASSFPREGLVLQWQLFTNTQHIWILLQVGHSLLHLEHYDSPSAA